MRNNVFELLSFLDWEKTLSEETFALSILFLSLFRLKIGVDTHKTSHSTDIFVSKRFKIFEDSKLWWFSTNVKKNADFWIELSTEPLKEPEMRG